MPISLTRELHSVSSVPCGGCPQPNALGINGLRALSVPHGCPPIRRTAFGTVLRVGQSRHGYPVRLVALDCLIDYLAGRRAVELHLPSLIVERGDPDAVRVFSHTVAARFVPALQRSQRIDHVPVPVSSSGSHRGEPSDDLFDVFAGQLPDAVDKHPVVEIELHVESFAFVAAAQDIGFRDRHALLEHDFARVLLQPVYDGIDIERVEPGQRRIGHCREPVGQAAAS
ncbi:hypothetical protein [Burkholderia pyrrocinia]|uniref:hypothetical protein n=1 Tax=Burkholderia pyrrocinia TaxID=60550 RepID=UPI001EE6D218|nr:hypothetical protein [Burkholderia pyrrocinia]